MIVIPAIDLLNNECVRLHQGNYDEVTSYNADPVKQAQFFEENSFTHLHVVDLEGARSKHVVHDLVLKNICQSTSLEIDFGGGIKTEEDLQKALKSGAAAVTLGSIAVQSPEICQIWIQKYGAEKFIIGADVKHDKIATHGWTQTADKTVIELIQDYMKLGLNKVICTDVSKDGTMQGPAIDLYKKIITHCPGVALIASGGIGKNEDFDALDGIGCYATITGKALYENKIDLQRIKSGHWILKEVER